MITPPSTMEPWYLLGHTTPRERYPTLQVPDNWSFYWLNEGTSSSSSSSSNNYTEDFISKDEFKV
jgi:hypothetical protein